MSTAISWVEAKDWALKEKIFSASSRFICGDCGKFNAKQRIMPARYNGRRLACSQCAWCGVANAFGNEQFGFIELKESEV